MKKLIIGIMAALFVALPLAFAQPQHAAALFDNAKTDACTALNSSDPACKNGGTTINSIIKMVVNVFSAVVGVAAVVMIIVGGFKYVTSGGDSNSVASAKNTIIWAIVGLIVVALAQTIVRFTLESVSKKA